MGPNIVESRCTDQTNRIRSPIRDLIAINHDMTLVVMSLPDGALDGNANGTTRNPISRYDTSELAVLGNFLSQRNRGEDINSKLFVPSQLIVGDQKGQTIGRRPERTREQQSTAFTVFNCIAQDDRLKRHAIVLRKETYESQTVGKTTLHDVVSNAYAVPLSRLGFSENMVTLTRTYSSGQCGFEPL
jgi:hypothetical protein